jgi:hypothetical protein
MGVEASRGALHPKARALHRSIDVHCDPGKATACQGLEGNVAHHRGQPLDHLEGQPLEPPDHRPIARQPAPAHEAQEDRIALQDIEMGDASPSGQQEPDQAKHHPHRPIVPAQRQAPECLAQPAG